MSRKILTIDLIPSTAWYLSLYNYYLDNKRLGEWYALKEKIYKKEGKKCWICNSLKGPFEAHEFWEYNEKKHIQKLKSIHHLCGLCHKVKHIGFWCYTDDGLKKLKRFGLTKKDIMSHFCYVNTCTAQDFNKYINEVFEIWEKRSNYKWKQDFGGFGPD